jgi:hypothetical protein
MACNSVFTALFQHNDVGHGDTTQHSGFSPPTPTLPPSHRPGAIRCLFSFRFTLPPPRRAYPRRFSFKPFTSVPRRRWVVLIPRENDFTLPLYPRCVCTSCDAIAITRRWCRWFLDIRRWPFACRTSLRFEHLWIESQLWRSECDSNVRAIKFAPRVSSFRSKMFNIRATLGIETKGRINRACSLNFKAAVNETKYSVAKTARMNMQYPEASARASAAPTMKPFVTETRPASILCVNRQRQSAESRFQALFENPNRTRPIEGRSQGGCLRSAVGCPDL